MNMLTKRLIEEIKTAPETVQREVLDFLVFLKARQIAQAEGRENLLPLADTAWAADWSTPEEEEAWKTSRIKPHPGTRLCHHLPKLIQLSLCPNSLLNDFLYCPRRTAGKTVANWQFDGKLIIY